MNTIPPDLGQFVLSWLSQILPPDPDADADATVPNPLAKRTSLSPSRSDNDKPSRKRPRLLGSTHEQRNSGSLTYASIPSPPATAVSCMAPHPNPQPSGEKRPREESDNDDDDRINTTSSGPIDPYIMNPNEPTPRPDRRSYVQPGATMPLAYHVHPYHGSNSVPSTVAPSISSHAPSVPSRTSSPTKQMRYASLDITGYSIKSFSADATTMPASLEQVLLHLTDIQDRVAIIPINLKDELANYRIRDFSFYDPGASPQRWQFPSVAFVKKTMDRAIQCGVARELESSWNQDVHRPLLDYVFRPNTGCSALDFRYCNAASIIPHFRPKTVPSKMVDYCVHVVTTPEERARIDQLCTSRPAASINHTDWGNLSGDPIALSIETKRDGEGLEQALSQVGTWHAAQWRSLLLEKRHTPAGIDFLPALIAQGHSWYFVATTRHDSGQAWLYTKVEVGTTETLVGTFQILVALQYFKCWIEDTYWPAFRRYVLALD